MGGRFSVSCCFFTFDKGFLIDTEILIKKIQDLGIDFPENLICIVSSPVREDNQGTHPFI
ncbi:hypothetical protein LptCag_1473 [Leptospirillum ferriphilum]|uniref:Uncharacterized protein n=1 Tax=Leptospirillum ferriphilum TaxID=178606 RepID=A0A094W8B1_9BACT|nr:hypothetical protein LptCag_1473 [Leptospirillum ferriphilum]